LIFVIWGRRLIETADQSSKANNNWFGYSLTRSSFKKTSFYPTYGICIILIWQSNGHRETKVNHPIRAYFHDAKIT
jgi:hypothetical protein